MHKAVDRPSLSIVGFFLSEIGLGQAARNIASSLDAVNIPINCINIDLPGRSNMSEFAHKCGPWVAGVNNFYVTEMDLVARIPREIEGLGRGIREFLYPAWELDRLPEQVVEALPFYDEIFAPSQFIANTFSQYLNKEVTVIPQPVAIPEQVIKNTIADGKLRVFTFFDTGSYAERKNPQAAINAFQIAFPKAQKDVELLIKVRGFGGDEIRKILLEAALMDPRIRIIDKTLDRKSIDLLIQGCNVFLSLHRSEGFGFGPAESMAFEKIVISTDYGGTRDFVTPQTGYPVEYKLIPIKLGQYPYYQHQLWADPSIEQAAFYLKEVYDNFKISQEKAKQGRKLIITQHSFAAVGKKINSIFIDRGYL
jgi:glycosyltransferase involved in cell wall biosynthesis